MSAREELVDFIISLTPEKLNKLLAHPEFIAIMESEQKKEQATI